MTCWSGASAWPDRKARLCAPPSSRACNWCCVRALRGVASPSQYSLSSAMARLQSFNLRAGNAPATRQRCSRPNPAHPGRHRPPTQGSVGRSRTSRGCRGAFEIPMPTQPSEPTSKCALWWPVWPARAGATRSRIRRSTARWRRCTTTTRCPGTLEDLAHRAGLSRTGLAERLRVAMGDPPLSDLRRVSGSARGALAAAVTRARRDSGAHGPRPTTPKAAARRLHRTPPTAVPLAARPTPAPA